MQGHKTIVDGGWPKNDGFAGVVKEEELKINTRLDRLGNENGTFLAPAGTPMPERALAPGSNAEQLTEYVVIKPLPVKSGQAAPAFDQPGGGIQFKSNVIDPETGRPATIEWLLRNEYITEVKE